jgi:ribosome-binding factor A
MSGGARADRIADQVRELVSELLTFEVRDPGVGLVTVTHVKVAGDLQLATVYYTLVGDERERRDTSRALARATAFLRRRVAESLNLRRAPELRFHYDEHVERQQRVETLLEEIARERAAREQAGDPDAGGAAHGDATGPAQGAARPDEPTPKPSGGVTS